MDRLFASEQDFAHKLEQMIKLDTERGRPFAIIKEGWPEDYTAMIQAGARAMKETGVKLPVVNAAIDKVFVAWLQRNITLAVAADDAALQNVLDRVVPFYRRLQITDREICRTIATASLDDRDTIVRALGRIPKAEVRTIENERRLIMLSVVESIASGRRLPQQRPGMGPGDYVALFWQLADRGMSLNDFHALKKGLLPAEEFCDKFVNIYEAIASIPIRGNEFAYIWTSGETPFHHFTAGEQPHRAIVALPTWQSSSSTHSRQGRGVAVQLVDPPETERE